MSYIEAKTHVRTMILTALANSERETMLDPANSWQIIADAVLNQITQPHSQWALKELSRPSPYQESAPKRASIYTGE